MDRYDEDTERYLREFRLRAIPPLAFAPKAGNIFITPPCRGRRGDRFRSSNDLVGASRNNAAN